MAHIESDKHLGALFTHDLRTGEPRCPECGAFGKRIILEQGFDYNHRHHCFMCGVTYWITRS